MCLLKPKCVDKENIVWNTAKVSIKSTVKDYITSLPTLKMTQSHVQQDILDSKTRDWIKAINVSYIHAQNSTERVQLQWQYILIPLPELQRTTIFVLEKGEREGEGEWNVMLSRGVLKRGVVPLPFAKIEGSLMKNGAIFFNFYVQEFSTIYIFMSFL